MKWGRFSHISSPIIPLCSQFNLNNTCNNNYYNVKVGISPVTSVTVYNDLLLIHITDSNDHKQMFDHCLINQHN